MSKREVSLYIHIPYCQRRCRYCDFTSFADRNDTFREYKHILLQELLQYKDDSLLIKTIFIGGGTPSAVERGMIGEVLDAVFKNFSVDENAEVTVECNPCSATMEKLCEFKAHGVNRISIGVQSFDNGLLGVLGRLHGAGTAVECVKNARAVGFENISVDLMLAIPGQTMDMLLESLKTAIDLGVNHISLYSLILEEGTALTKMVENGELAPIDDESDRRMYCSAVEYLCKAGYEQYEISNFARQGYESEHNIAYWVRNDYIGIGCSAHSCCGGVRYANTSDLDAYLSGRANGKLSPDREELTKTDIAEETVMLGLRMNKGFEYAAINSVIGDDFCVLCRKSIEKLRTAGLVNADSLGIRLTDRGRDLLDSVIVELISNF